MDKITVKEPASVVIRITETQINEFKNIGSFGEKPKDVVNKLINYWNTGVKQN